MVPPTSRPEAIVRANWDSLTGESYHAFLADLLARHGDPRRHYHNITHVAWVLQHCREMLDELPSDERSALDVAAIQLALLCHDVIYDPASTTNEADSATFARRCAAAFGWTAERQRLVERLVLATATHRPADLAEAVVVDADLAVLGAGPADYDAYCRAVRAEYGHLSDDQWRAGRAAVLEHLLATESLFTTTFMKSRREQSARDNLRRELAMLRAAASEPTP